MMNIRTKFLIIGLVVTATALGQNFSSIDSQANELRLRNPTTEKLANAIEGNTQQPVEQLRVLYVYIGNTIKYDVDGFFSGQPSPLEPNDVLRARRAVCEGYSKLFADVAQKLGIEAQIIAGASKGYGFGGSLPDKSDHAWVAVRVNNKWHLIDPTWGAGHLNEAGKYQMQFQPRYFMTPPERFVIDHLPEDPAWQLLPCPITAKEFLKDSTAIVERALDCPTPTFSYADTIAANLAASEEEQVLNKSARIARNSQFGLLSAAIMVLNLGADQSIVLNDDSMELTARLAEAYRIKELYSIALNYASSSKARERRQTIQVINGNIKQLDNFIKTIEDFLASQP